MTILQKVPVVKSFAIPDTLSERLGEVGANRG
jgi:hypothetical protein